MTRTDLRKSYEILELPDGASLREVQNAYLHLRKLYAGNSVALAPLEEEFSDKTRLKILQLEEERFEGLPQEPYLKGHLQSIAWLLGLQPDRVAEDYPRRFRDWKDNRGKE